MYRPDCYGYTDYFVFDYDYYDRGDAASSSCVQYPHIPHGRYDSDAAPHQRTE